jgi:hypothetical protein
VAIVNIPKLELRIVGDRAYCGRLGCDRLIGRVSHPSAAGVKMKILRRSTGLVEDLPRAASGYVTLAEANYGETREAPERWHARTLEDGTRQWEQARRARRLPWDPFRGTAADLGPTWGKVAGPGDIVVCPNEKCLARQRVPALISR